ncbi:MAG: hypothetical protein WD844_04615 [Thermoleophilaceae bacterium]
MTRTQTAMRAMAKQDPELGARLVLMTMPALANGVSFDLEVEGMGTTRVGDGEPGFRLLTSPSGLAELAGGASPLRLMLGGRLRIRGSRRKALGLRSLGDGELSLADVVRSGGRIDPDPVYRALTYLIDPEWTRGHSFTVAYEVGGAGTWFVTARDGEPVAVGVERPERVDATARVDLDTYHRLIGGEMTPTQAMQRQLTWVDGDLHPVVLLGRWIERAQGRDDDELAREAEQRRLLEARGPTWGASSNGLAGAGQGDPAHESESARRESRDLLTYGQLYALWERQNWKAHELDFSVDREQWLASPREAQENTAWSLGSFYIGEERVTADLAPFLMAAPAARWRSSSPPSSWTRRDTPRSSTASGPRSWRWSPTTCATACAISRRRCCRPGTTCSTTGCARPPTGSRPGRTTSTCSWRASPPTT